MSVHYLSFSMKIFRFFKVLTIPTILINSQKNSTRKAERLNLKHKETIISLRSQGIFAQVHYIPVHLQPYYQNLGFKQGDFPNAEHYYHRVISLPLYPQLSKQEQDYIIEQVKGVL